MQRRIESENEKEEKMVACGTEGSKTHARKKTTSKAEQAEKLDRDK